jgi:CubicO group peptidase (beta-lactamase class C family)
MTTARRTTHVDAMRPRIRPRIGPPIEAVHQAARSPVTRGVMAILAAAGCLAASGAPIPAPPTSGAAPPGPLPNHAYVHYTVPRPPGAAPDPLFGQAAGATNAGLDAEALTHLLLRARALHSDAVVVVRDGRLAADVRFDKPVAPIELNSATRSVAALAIGHLLQTGKIRSLDEPVARWYPQWENGPKRSITLRQLLAETSGIKADPKADEIYRRADLVQMALDADVSHPPGSHFFYNHKAVNLLAGIVEKASGAKLDEYMRDEIFAPLGIAAFSWMRDPAGNPHVLAGLELDARDLARIGQLMLDGGNYNGRRLLPAAFVEQAVHAAQPFSPTSGLLWWVLPEWTRLGIDEALLASWRRGGAEPEFLAAVTPLAGRAISRADLFAALDLAFGRGKGVEAWVRNVAARYLPTPKVTTGPAVGFYANGSLGQYLVVIPATRLVAVRQIREASHKGSGDDFEDFPDLVRALVPTPQPPPAVRAGH